LGNKVILGTELEIVSGERNKPGISSTASRVLRTRACFRRQQVGKESAELSSSKQWGTKLSIASNREKAISAEGGILNNRESKECKGHSHSYRERLEGGLGETGEHTTIGRK